MTVPATIKYKGKTYKVTEVASGALRGKKKLQTDCYQVSNVNKDWRQRL